MPFLIDPHMKKRVIAAVSLLLAAGICSFAQSVQEAAAKAAEALAQTQEEQQAPAKPNYWTHGLKFDLGFTNTILTNWAAGGYNQTSLASAVDGFANYKKGLTYWNNRLQLDYGFFYSEDKPVLQKNKDRILFDSKWGQGRPAVRVPLPCLYDPFTRYRLGAEALVRRQLLPADRRFHHRPAGGASEKIQHGA